MNHAVEARRLLRHTASGALATHSRRMPGYPYVTILPFMVDHEACPVMLISRLAEHTKNIAADARVSIAVQPPVADVQAAARLTLVGHSVAIEPSATLRARYLRYYPHAAQLFELDFELYRIVPEAIRYIGGFGAVHWISPGSFKSDPDAIPSIEDGLLEHMNQGHVQALRDCCHHVHAVHCDDPLMIGLDCDGFDVRAAGQLLRFDFPETVYDAQTARDALIALVRSSPP
jgi:hypothetical protein